MGNGNTGMQSPRQKSTQNGGNLPTINTATSSKGNNKQPFLSRVSTRKVTLHAPTAYVSGDREWNLIQALTGNPKVDAKTNPEIVRIFISSTFTDTRQERNALMENVFPLLKSYCQDHGYDFQVVDMRWGVRDEVQDDHLTTELCLKELEACKNMSTGPNFVTLLSHKYGHRPFPRKIPANEFKKILSASSPSERYILEEWFLLDENIIPPEYILQPISKNLPDYRSKDEKAKKAAVDKWWEIFETLRKTITAAVRKELPERFNYYTMSVTEQEVTHGLVNQEHPNGHCLSFNRTIDGITSVDPSHLLSKYYECRGLKSELEEVHHRMHHLREETLSSALQESRILRYQIPWYDKGVDPQECEDHKSYIQKFCSDFESRIRAMIDAGIAERLREDIDDDSYKEVVQHYTFYRQKSDRFVGRQSVVKRLKSYITGQNTQPLIVHGKSGCGKTAILAVAAQNAHPWTNGACITVFRFLGTTRSSSSLFPLLTSLTEQISRVYKSRIRPSKTLRELVRDFQATMRLATASRPLVLILDSLDQLDATDGGRHLHWLPRDLPSNVKLILSTLPDKMYQSYQRCLGLYRKQSSYLEVPPMDDNDLKAVLDTWLSKDKRALVDHQREMLISAFRTCPVALYMKLSYDEAVRWHSYDPPSKSQLKETIKDTIHTLLWRIERKHGHLIVSHALGCLTASQNGVAEGEIEDLLSLSDDVLNDVYQYWTPPARRLPPLLWVRIRSELSEYLVERGTDSTQVITWNHRQFVEVAQSRYLKESDDIFRYHLALSEFFIGLWADKPKPYVSKKGEEGKALRYVAKQPLRFENGEYNLRKLHQLPYHLISARELTALKKQVLFNYNFLVAKMAATSYTTVIRDFKLARAAFPADKDLQVLTETLQLSQEALSFTGIELAGQLLGRIHGTGSSNLLSQAQEALDMGLLPEEAVPILSLLEAYEEQVSTRNKYIEGLLKEAQNCKVATLVPDRGFLTPPGGRLLYQLAGHSVMVADIDITHDGKLVVTGAADQTVKMWNVEDGELRHSMDLPHPVGRVMFITDDQNLLVSCQGGIVYLIDVQTSFIQTEYREMTNDDRKDMCMPIALLIDNDNTEYLVAMRNKFIDIWDIVNSKRIRAFPVNISDWSTENKGYNVEGRHLQAFDETIVYAGYKSHSYHIVTGIFQSTGITVPLFSETQIDLNSETPSFCPDHKNHISALAISGDGSLVFASNGATGDIHLNRIIDGKRITKVRGEKNSPIINLYMPFDGDVLFQAKYVNVGTWSPRTNEHFEGLSHPCTVRKVVSANGQNVATIAEDSIVRLWDLALEPFEADLSAFTGKVNVGESADISALQSQFDAMFGGIVGDDASKFNTRDILTKSSSKNYWTLPDSDGHFEQRVISRFFLFESGFYVVVVNYDLNDTYSICLTIWELSHMTCVRRMILPPKSVYIHTVFDDSTVVLSENRKIKLMDIKRFTITQVLQGKAPDSKTPVVLYISKRKELVTESRGGRYLKVYDPLQGEVKGEFIPSKQGIPEFLSTVLHPQVNLKSLQVNESATILAGLYVSGTPVIYLWTLEERKVVYVVNSRSIFSGLKDETICFTTSGDNLVVWKDTNKLDQPGVDDVAIINSSTGHSNGHAKRRSEKDKAIAVQKVPILRRMGRSHVQMIGITKDNKGVILGERCVGSNANRIKVTSNQSTLVTWCDQPKEKTIQYWACTDNIQPLGTFTPDQEVADLALRPGCTELIIDSTTGAVKLKLSIRSSTDDSIPVEPGNKIYSDIVYSQALEDLNVPFPVGGEEDFLEEDDDPDMDIDPKT